MMDKALLKKEALMQKKCWDNLRKWLLYALVASSILAACIYFAFSKGMVVAGVISVVLLVADVVWMFVILSSLKHGRANIEKLLKLCEQ